MFWTEKARLQWHISGNRNINFFHRMAKIKRSRSIIATLKVGDNSITDPGEMANLAVDYFTNIFCFVGPLQDCYMMDDAIPNPMDD